jgi:hypothetical protein
MKSIDAPGSLTSPLLRSSMPSSVQDALERHYLPLPIYRANETVERSSAAETEIPKPDFEPCLSNATRIKTLGGSRRVARHLAFSIIYSRMVFSSGSSTVGTSSDNQTGISDSSYTSDSSKHSTNTTDSGYKSSAELGLEQAGLNFGLQIVSLNNKRPNLG